MHEDLLEFALILNTSDWLIKLISTQTKNKENINLIKVETAEEMFKATQNNLPTDIAIFSDAVADFKVSNKNKDKIKKQENLNINLEKNIDILNYVKNNNTLRQK